MTTPTKLVVCYANGAKKVHPWNRDSEEMIMFISGRMNPAELQQLVSDVRDWPRRVTIINPEHVACMYWQQEEAET